MSTTTVDLKQLLAGAQLPALPQSAIRLLELSQDPENGPPEFALLPDSARCPKTELISDECPIHNAVAAEQTHQRRAVRRDFIFDRRLMANA